MRQKKNLFKGIVATKQAKKFLKNKAKSLSEMMEEDALGWKDLSWIARMFFDTPADAIRAIRKGSALFRDFPMESYALCGHIYGELLLRKKQKKILKRDPNYSSLNRIVSDHLDVLCSYLNFNYANIEPSKSEIKSGVKRKPNLLPRQPIIDRCIERYRRLVLNNKKKFLIWWKLQERNRTDAKQFAKVSAYLGSLKDAPVKYVYDPKKLKSSK